VLKIDRFSKHEVFMTCIFKIMQSSEKVLGFREQDVRGRS